MNLYEFTYIRVRSHSCKCAIPHRNAKASTWSLYNVVNNLTLRYLARFKYRHTHRRVQYIRSDNIIGTKERTAHCRQAPATKMDQRTLAAHEVLHQHRSTFVGRLCDDLFGLLSTCRCKIFAKSITGSQMQQPMPQPYIAEARERSAHRSSTPSTPLAATSIGCNNNNRRFFYSYNIFIVWKYTSWRIVECVGWECYETLHALKQDAVRIITSQISHVSIVFKEI